MKVYRLSWFDMYGAHRAGKSYAHIARAAGCSPGVVRYRVTHFQWSERFWREHVQLSRLVRHNGHRIVKGSWQMHDYVFHREGEQYCDRCRTSRSWWGRLLTGAARGLTSGEGIAGLLSGAVLGGSSSALSTGMFERPRRVASRAEIEAMDWPTELPG